MNQPNQLTFTTFNLFNYLEPPNAYYEFENIYAFDEWEKKRQWIKDALVSVNSDVIGFQEVFSPQSLQQLMSELDYPYFAVVDEAQVEDDYLFHSPVVAVASRYPIKTAQAVVPSEQVLAKFGLSHDFDFNRRPVHATIELPHLGLTDVYVVHFKSQRPTEQKKEVEPDASTGAPILGEKPRQSDGSHLSNSSSSSTLTRFHDEQLGSWLSSVQRGLEANLLHHYITQQRHVTEQPVLLMGDFNKPLFSDEFKGLLNDTIRFDAHSTGWLSYFKLKDSWDLYHQLHQEDLLGSRQPTHYYGAKGSVLDYVLMSNEFDCQNSSSLMEVSGYRVLDEHLINPNFERDQFSTDHAVVSVTASIRQG